MSKVHWIAGEWAVTRSIPRIETLWAAFLYDERRAGRLSNQASAGQDLKSLLAPFKNNLDGLRSFVAGTKAAIGGASKSTGHGVFSKSREIPVASAGPGGEPDAVMGDLSALGGPKSDDSDSNDSDSDDSNSDDELRKRLATLTRKLLGRRR
jgi:hypothetical protein